MQVLRFTFWDQGVQVQRPPIGGRRNLQGPSGVAEPVVSHRERKSGVSLREVKGTFGPSGTASSPPRCPRCNGTEPDQHLRPTRRPACVIVSHQRPRSPARPPRSPGRTAGTFDVRAGPWTPPRLARDNAATTSLAKLGSRSHFASLAWQSRATPMLAHMTLR